MASSLAMGGTLQYLRDLIRDGTAVGLGDGQLLSRYADSRDEAAFEALVARHGPMVLATCRAVLRHEPDVEDAFQATFLVLAQRARSVRAGDALGDWLHRVAYRVSLRAGTSSQRRRRREAEARAMATAVVTPTVADPDLAAIVHEEVDRLPEKHRLPVVLCDLEGLTYEQAATRLRWTEPTLRNRLVKARQQLRGRLARRGLTAVAVGAVLASARSGARAAVPASWGRAAVSAAAGGTASVTVTALAAAFIRGMIVTRVMIASTGMLAVIAIGSVGALSLGSWRLDPPAPARAQQAGDGMKRPAASGTAPTAGGSAEARGRVAAVPQSTPRPLDPPGKITVRGRVLAPDGRTVPGAKLYMTLAWGYPHEPSPSPEFATTGPDGRFAFAVSEAEFGDPYLVVAATAPGHGAGWVKVPVEGRRDDLTIRLAVDDVPITGQIIDLQGKPIAGVTLRLLQINAAPNEDLEPWLEAVRTRKVRRLELEQQYLKRFTLAVPLQVTTDSAGRFRLTGIGRNRLVSAQLDGPTITSQHIYMLTRPGKAIEATEVEAMPGNDPRRVVIYYGADFRHAAAPTRPIVGVVRDQETGRPLAGVAIRSLSLKVAPHASESFDLVRTTTDAQGRYTLTGMPRRAGNQIAVHPNGDQPYVAIHKDIPDRPGLDPVTVDIELKRGIWIEGRISDKRTGRPLRGRVEYFALASNPSVQDYPGFDGTFSFLDAGLGTKEDGSYRVVGLPGPGLVVVHHLDDYLRANQRDGEFGVKETSLNTAPYALHHTSNYGAIARIDPARGVHAVEQDVTLDPGWTFTGTVLGPDGKPLAGARRLIGMHWRDPEGMKSPEFAMQGLDPHGLPELLFQHPEQWLIGVARPPNEIGGSVTVRMQPGGSVEGRLVDRDGRPRPGVEVEVEFRTERSDRPWLNYVPGRIQTDREGRFRVQALLPGYEFRLTNGEGVVPLGSAMLHPVQVRDLGDMKMKPSDD